MNNNVVAFDAVKMPSLQMSEAELLLVLRNSLYPGAKDESIKLVISYCRAAGLDPMQKPVHIVPMDVKSGKEESGKDIYIKRDVIMPGVGSYRTQAARTGLYAGMSEPQFGPTKKIATKLKQWNNAHKGDRTFTMVDGPDIEFPDWCRITVRRMLGNQTVEFTAIEYWQENYATAGNDTTAPNAMWKKRPFGQIAKCAEAQALRKAFPEFGAQPTADEMEGRQLSDDSDEVVVLKPQLAGVKAKSEASHVPVTFDQVATPEGDKGPAQQSTTTTEKSETTQVAMTAGQKKILAAKLKNAGLTDIDVKAKFGRGLDDDGWSFDHFPQVQDWCAERAGA